MTTEEKARAYDKALKQIKECTPDENGFVTIYPSEIFSGLKENEDEKIRKALIRYFTLSDEHAYNEVCGVSYRDIVAWLEKQGEQKYIQKDVDDAYLKGITDTKNEIEKQYEETYQIRKDIATFIFNYRGDIKDRAKWIDYLGIKVSFVENQNEQNNFAPKIEPKFNFKVGQWIVATGKCVYLIAKIDGFNVTLVDTNGNEYVFDASSLDDVHEWTIQDAKDGDALADGTTTFIFKDLLSDGSVMSYCDYDTDSGESDAFCPLSMNLMCSKITPTTKEQRELLFQKMNEVGYEWDAEKKELKKIDNEDVNGEDYGIDSLYHARRILEKTLGKVDGYQSDDGILEHKCAITAIKKLYEQKPTEWSEEDEKMFEYALDMIEWYSDKNEDKSRLVSDWLKLLKDRYNGDRMNN